VTEILSPKHIAKLSRLREFSDAADHELRRMERFSVFSR
jgi:hypothetical protein